MNHINLPTPESTYLEQVKNKWQYKSAKLLTLSKKEVHHHIVTLLEDRLRQHLSWSLDIVRVRGDAETSFSDLNTIVPDIWVETLSNNPVSDQQIVETSLVVSVIDYADNDEEKQALDRCLSIKGLRELVLINIKSSVIKVLRRNDDLWSLSTYDQNSIVPIEIVNMHFNAYELWANCSALETVSKVTEENVSEFTPQDYDGGMVLYRPDIKPLESGRSYLIRLTETLDYKSPEWITSSVGENIRGIHNEKVLDKIAPVLRYSPKNLKKHFYLPVSGTGDNGLRSFFGHIIKNKYLSLSTSRVCPLCIKEYCYIKGHWDINLITACPEHGCELINTCPDCFKPLAWNRTSLSKCKCGHNLTEVRVMPASQNTVNMTKVMYQVMDPTQKFIDAGGAPDFSPYLFELSLESLLKITHYIGLKFREKQENIKYKARKKSALHNRSVMVETAGAVLSDWPHNYHEQLYITNITYEVKTKNNEQVIKKLRYFYQDLIKYFGEAEFKFLRDAFDDYLNKYWETIFRALLLSNGVNIYPNWFPSEQLSGLKDRSDIRDYCNIYDLRKIIGLDGRSAVTGQDEIWLDQNYIEMCIKEYIKSSSKESIKKNLDIKIGRILNILIKLNNERGLHDNLAKVTS